MPRRGDTAYILLLMDVRGTASESVATHSLYSWVPDVSLISGNASVCLPRIPGG